jgi:phosphohistidine phosphatase
MNLYFVRHGEAESRSEHSSDTERKLTKEGIWIVQASTRFWKNFITSIDAIVSSPLIRTTQTAEIIRDEFKLNEKIIKDNSLLNGGKTQDIMVLSESLGKNDIVLVEHQPDLSEHVSKLTSFLEINLRLSPAAIVKISFDKRPVIEKGMMEFLIPPLRQI